MTPLYWFVAKGVFMLQSCLLLPKKQKLKKGKTIPVQAWTHPEGSRRLRLPDFKTMGN
jgi:hypothetical protein